MVCVGLALPLLLFRFCEVFTCFYFFCISLAQTQLPHAGLSFLIRKMSLFFFLQQAVLWILMRHRHAGCETIWVYGGNPRRGQGGATCSKKPSS